MRTAAFRGRLRYRARWGSKTPTQRRATVPGMPCVRESHKCRLPGPTQKQDNMITDVAAITAAVTEHLAYLDGQSSDCTESAKQSTPIRAAMMKQAASVYAEVAAELRNTLGMEPT
jgi:hypothetical protein